MKPKEQPARLILTFQQQGGSPVSALPLWVQPEATNFLRFADTLLARLHSLTTALCQEYLEELQYCPEHYNRVAAYHVDLLARKIRKEVDALYQALCASTIEHIELWVERQSLQALSEEHQQPPSAC